MKRRDFLRYSLAGGLVLSQPQRLLAATEPQLLEHLSLYNPTRYLFIVDSESAFITVLDVKSGQQIDLLNFNLKPEIVEISRDDSIMVVASSESQDLILYDLKTRLQRVVALPSPIQRAVFIPQSTLLAIGMRDQLGLVNYQTGALKLYSSPFDLGAIDEQGFSLLFSSFTRTYWLLDKHKPHIYHRSSYDAEDAPWAVTDLSERLTINSGFDGGVVTPGNYMMALTATGSNEGYVYYIDEDRLCSTGPMGSADAHQAMVRPYIDSFFRRALFANAGGHVALFDFEKSKEATHFTVDFSPREFRTGWLETTLILGGDKALQFQSFDDPKDKTLIELPAAVADMWVSGDSKTLYLTLEDGEPQVLRYDIRRREPLAPLLIHGVIKGAALRMGSTNSVCH